MPMVDVRMRQPGPRTRPAGSGAVQCTFVVAPTWPESVCPGAHVYCVVVDTACTADEPNDSNTVVVPSSMMRMGCGVCVAPCASETLTDISHQYLPVGTVSVI